MSDPLEQAVKAFESAPMCEPCNTETPFGYERPTVCFCTQLGILAALPHFRRMHFQEAAELVEKRNEYLEAEEAGLGSPTAEYKAWKEAASFLRGVQ